MIEKMNGERFTFENHTRNNDLKEEELIGLIKNEKCAYADEIVGFTKNPSYVNRHYSSIMWGLMFTQNGKEFWIHVNPAMLEVAMNKAYGVEKAEEIYSD